MRGKQASATVTIVVLLATATIVGSAVGVGLPTAPDLGRLAGVPCVPHPPILVVGDVGPLGLVLSQDPVTGIPVYRPGSGVLSGRGTPDDPYVLGGWCIDVREYEHSDVHIDPFLGLGPDWEPIAAIELQATSAHVRIAGNELSGSIVEAVRLVGASNVEVAGNEVKGSRWGVRLTDYEFRPGLEQLWGFGVLPPFPEIHHITVDANHFHDLGQEGIVVWTDGSASYANRFSDNLFERSGGISCISTCDDTEVAGNLLRSNSGAIAVQGTRIDVHHNTVEDNQVGGVAGTFGGGIWFGGSDNVVRDNVVQRNDNGITFGSGTGNAVLRNIVRDNDGPGIRMRAERFSEVRNNLIENNGAGDPDGFGIDLRGPNHHATIVDNVIRGNAAGGIKFGIYPPAPPGPIHGAVVNGNNIEDNHGLGLRLYRVTNTIDARMDWWGCPAGPDDPACDQVDPGIGGVDYVPWLTEPNALAGP